MVSIQRTISQEHAFTERFIEMCRELNANGRLPRQFLDDDRALRVHVHDDGREVLEAGPGRGNWHTTFEPGRDHFSLASETVWLPTTTQSIRLAAAISGEDPDKLRFRVTSAALSESAQEEAALMELAEVLPPAGSPVAEPLERENLLIAWSILHEGIVQHEARRYFPARLSLKRVMWPGAGRVAEIAAMHLAILETPVGARPHSAGIAGYKRARNGVDLAAMEAAFSELFAAEGGAQKVHAQDLRKAIAATNVGEELPAAPAGLSTGVGHLYSGRLAWALGDAAEARQQWALAANARESRPRQLAELLIGYLHRETGGFGGSQVV